MLSRYSVKRPYTVVVGIVLILLLGYVSFSDMQTDLLPDMTLPYAVVYTAYPGASPEEVESVVTRPVEQAMATTSNIENINSVSSENMSVVVLEFSQSANMDAVTIEMRESLDQIESYWDDSIGSPIIMKMNPDMLPVMVAAMEAGELTQSELTDLVNNEVLPELESIEGVASVSVNGTIEEQVQVLLREEKIKEVNKKIRSALDEQFEEAQSELEEAQAELEDGEQKLADGQAQLADQTAAAQGQLNSGTSQMITGQVQIDQKLAEVEAGLKQIETSESELAAQEKELLEGEAALKELPAQKEALAAQQTQMEQAISQLEAAPTQLAGMEAAIVKLDAEIAALNEAIAQLQEHGGGDAQMPGEEQSETGEETQPAQTDMAESEPDGETGDLVLQEQTLTQASDQAPAVGEAQEEIIIEETQTDAGAAQNSETDGSGMTADGSGAQTEDSLTILSQEVIGQVTQDAQTQAQIAQLQSQVVQKEAEKASYESAKAQAMAALASLGVNTGGSYIEMTQSIDTIKSELVSRKLQLDDGMTTLQKSLDQMPEQLASIAAGKSAIASGKVQLSSGKTQLQQAKAQLRQAKVQIGSGQSTVTEAIAQLNRAQISATIEMAVGKAQLSAGKDEIETALEQVRTQKETAYDQADASQIITAEMVKGILAAQNFSMPAGYVTEEGTDFLIRIGNKFDEVQDLNDLVILDRI